MIKNSESGGEETCVFPHTLPHNKHLLPSTLALGRRINTTVPALKKLTVYYYEILLNYT